MRRSRYVRGARLCRGTPGTPPPGLWAYIPLLYEFNEGARRQITLHIEVIRRFLSAKDLRVFFAAFSVRAIEMRRFTALFSKSILRLQVEIFCNGGRRDGGKRVV